MTFSRTAPRDHLTYLRRRPKLSDSTAAPATVDSSTLTLRSSAHTPNSQRPARPVDGRALLTKGKRVVTLNRRQSAIGALTFAVFGGGELACCWELIGGESGLVSGASGVHVSPEFGRRPIVQLLDSRVVVGLRHARNLRRLLLLGVGLPTAPGARIVGDLLDGSTIESAHIGADPTVAALAAYRVHGELIIRREDAGFADVDAAAAAYGFSSTWLPPIDRP
jgi:hypothetical protein